MTHIQRAVGLAVLLTVGHSAAAPIHAQTAVIPNATPALVIERFQAHLGGQGFTLERQDEAGALFILDRGLVPQKYEGTLQPIVIELAIRLKPVKRGLQVRLSEEVVAYRGQAKEARKVVQAQSEIASLLRLLEVVRAELIAADSAAKRDST